MVEGPQPEAWRVVTSFILPLFIHVDKCLQPEGQEGEGGELESSRQPPDIPATLLLNCRVPTGPAHQLQVRRPGEVTQAGKGAALEGAILPASSRWQSPH